MFRILLSVVTCISLTHSQWFFRQFDRVRTQGHRRVRENSFDSNRRISRRVVTASEPLLTENSLDVTESRGNNNRRMFSPLFPDKSSINDPYLMIDPLKFTVLPAVPSQTQGVRAQKSFENNSRQNIFFPSTTLKPIAAVPSEKPIKESSSNSKESSDSESVRVPVNNDLSQETTNVIIRPRDERKKYKKCHGRCVQKFCLPIGSISKHTSCQETCKDICSV